MYYVLSNAVGTKETGPEYPQIKAMSKGYDLNTPNSVYALHNIRNEEPTFTPNLNAFVLHIRARFSDAISAGFIGGEACWLANALKTF